MIDERSINAVNVAERFANGMATLEELKEAGIAASEAINDALGTAAREAASTVAGVYTWNPSKSAALEAASSVASAVAWDSAYDAALEASWDSSRSAALEAASSAASEAAWDSARNEALDEALDAAIDEKKAQFIKVISGE